MWNASIDKVNSQLHRMDATTKTSETKKATIGKSRLTETTAAAPTPVSRSTRSQAKKRKVVLLSGLGTTKKPRSVQRTKAKEEMLEANGDDVGTHDSAKHTKENDSTVGGNASDNDNTKVVVLSTNQFAKSEDPKAERKRLLETLDSTNWVEQYENLDSIRRLAIHHCDSLVGVLPQIIPFLQASAQSLRSAQCRNALLAFADLYKHVGAQLRQKGKPKEKEGLMYSIDETVDVLLVKSVNDKRFIAVAGISAIRELADACACFYLLNTLLGHSNSKNGKICAQVGDASLRCLKRMNPKEDLNHAKIHEVIKRIARLESGRSIQARKPAQAMLRILYNALGKEVFLAEMKKVLAPGECARIQKVVSPHSTENDQQQQVARKPSIRELMMQKRQEQQGTQKLDQQAVLQESRDQPLSKPE